MRNFLHIASGVDVMPILVALKHQEHLWNEHELRRVHPGTPHEDVDDIWLRFQDLELTPEQIVDAHESINYTAWYALHRVRQIVHALMAQVEGERLGRVLITRLAPGKKIKPHVDGGDHAAYYKRYHLVLQTNDGVVFDCDGEAPRQRAGEIWHFDNSKMHFVENNGGDDRIVLIVDIKPCL
jgi:hypothetical protein